MIDIAYIVSHGFAARMVTQTDLLGLLVKEGKKVALICPDKNDENLKTYCENVGVILYEFSPESSFWTAQYADLRKYFLEDIDANVALKEKHIWATRYNKSKDPINKLKPYLAYLVYKLIKVFPIIRQWYKAREEKHLFSPLAEKLIQEIKPKILVSTYPVSFTEAMLLKAGNNHVNTKTIIHLLSWDNITCKGHFPQLADEYIAWGPIMKDEFMEYYNIPENKIHVCGVPHFDVHAESKKNPKIEFILQSLSLCKSDPYLFYGMSSPRFSPKEIDVVEWLAGAVNNNDFGANMQLIVRPHPQNVQGSMADFSWVPRLENIKSKKVAIDYPNLSESRMPWSMQRSDMVRLSQIIANSKVSINSCSTLSIDSLSAGVPVVLAGFDGDNNLDYWRSIRRVLDYPHLNKLLLTKGVTRAKNFRELKESILNFINFPDLNKIERVKAFELECNNFTNATENVVKILLNNVCRN